MLGHSVAAYNAISFKLFPSLKNTMLWDIECLQRVEIHILPASCALTLLVYSARICKHKVAKTSERNVSDRQVHKRLHRICSNAYR